MRELKLNWMFTPKIDRLLVGKEEQFLEMLYPLMTDDDFNDEMLIKKIENDVNYALRFYSIREDYLLLTGEYYQIYRRKLENEIRVNNSR